MELIEGVADDSPPTTACIGREMTRWEQIRSNIKYWYIRLRRKLPYLVWWNDELDVTVTLSQDKLDPTAPNPFKSLFGGAFYEVEKIFREMGISFDTGMGCEGRDWEWDFSLKGPISIRFRSRAQKPERRMERPKPTLVPIATTHQPVDLSHG